MQCTFEKNELAFVARLMYLGNLIVNGDRDTPHKYISAVLNAAAKAGCLQVRINAEVRKENP